MRHSMHLGTCTNTSTCCPVTPSDHHPHPRTQIHQPASRPNTPESPQTHPPASTFTPEFRTRSSPSGHPIDLVQRHLSVTPPDCQPRTRPSLRVHWLQLGCEGSESMSSDSIDRVAEVRLLLVKQTLVSQCGCPPHLSLQPLSPSVTHTRSTARMLLPAAAGCKRQANVRACGQPVISSLRNSTLSEVSQWSPFFANPRSPGVPPGLGSQ
jgi:hypothetical protein